MKISLPTLKENWEKDINFIINQSLLTVNPYQCAAVKINIRDDDIFIFGKKINLNKINDIYVIGVGKAVIPMAKAVIYKLGNRITSGFLISKHKLEKKDYEFEDIVCFRNKLK